MHAHDVENRSRSAGGRQADCRGSLHQSREVISELARRGLRAGSERSAPERFPVFKVPMNARVITPQRVAAALDDHD
jgi:hypothetical protein